MISRKGTYTFITLHQKSNACNFTQQLNFGWTLVSRLQSPWYSMSCQWKMQWTCIPNNFLFLFLVILLYLWISQGFSGLSQGFSWHLKSNLIKPAKFDCIWIVNIKGHSTLIWINALNVLQGLRNPPDSSPCNNKTEGFVWANYWSSEWWCLRILHCLASVV